MALRIGCDLDGTVADMSAALQREAEVLFGPDIDLRLGIGVPHEPPVDAEIAEGGEPAPAPDDGGRATANAPRGLTSREYRRLWAHVRKIENFWMSLNEVEPGAVKRLAHMAEVRGWEIIFLTKRPATAGELAQRQSQRWLAAQGFELPSVFVVEGSRGLIAASLHLDAVIDDTPENCLDVATDSRALPVLIWREAPQSAPPGAARMRIETVFSFSEALARLEAMCAGKVSGQDGVVGRIRRTLGV